MDKSTPQLEAFQELVAIKYQLYNSLFLTLPFANLPTVGAELPIFAKYCRERLAKHDSPEMIVETYFKDILRISDFNKQVSILFLMLQFVERQVVLFDSLEDAAFSATHDMHGVGTLDFFTEQLQAKNKMQEALHLLQIYRTRIVLTAHPTQFYPPEVLVIIQNLTIAVEKNDIQNIHDLLLQLGKTPFKFQEQPTPRDEADYLIHHLENILYPTIKKIQVNLHDVFSSLLTKDSYMPAVLEVGFWPGGDRDGNPNVTADTTLQVAHKLKLKIITLYIREVKALRKKLTFENMWPQLALIEKKLIAAKQDFDDYVLQKENGYRSHEEFIKNLNELRKIIVTRHQGLFAENVDHLIYSVKIFGFYFATLDIRQDSREHSKVLHTLFDEFSREPKQYQKLNADEKTQLLLKLLKEPALKFSVDKIKNKLAKDTIRSLQAIRIIQQNNGEKGCNRYVISNTQAVYNILEIMLLAYWSGWSLNDLSLDIVPLFETIEDLANAKQIMQELYNLPIYKKHLKHRQQQQTVMLGFSDGTKDGGYVTANWAIFRCKYALDQLAKEFGIITIFFDGRGGPPARGGSNTHKFYRALGNTIDQHQIQLTVQGQTITSKFGTTASAQFNLEQLLTAGLRAPLFPEENRELSKNEIKMLEKLSNLSFDAYRQLKQHPLFIDYLENITPLNYYGELNIASRPPRREKSGAKSFADLRAIPFVGAWSQMKQNIPGFYGVGSALETMVDEGYLEKLKKLYRESLYFRTLLENAMQSLKKSFFPLTAYLANDAKYGEFWRLLQHESKLSVKMVKAISEQQVLLQNDLLIRASIQLREQVVLPLLVIQQYAMISLRMLEQQGNPPVEQMQALHKIVLKSLAANINASRNSA